LRRFAELLRPGATLAVHEYSVADSQAARAIWNAVCWGIIIPAGWRQTRDSTLYRHLWRSVNTFDGASDFQRRLVATGFTGVHSETMPGWQRNIVHTFLGDKPMMGNS
jgi:ubiquinone/menaquinone biosynthesis C-methylase UbiE